MYIMCIDGALLIVIYWTYDATIIRTEIILGRRKKYIEITTATVGRFFFICLNLSFTARRVYNNNINDTPRPSVVSDFYNNNNIILLLLLLLLPTTVAPLWRLVLRSAGVSTRIYTYITTMMMIIIISIIYAWTCVYARSILIIIIIYVMCKWCILWATSARHPRRRTCARPYKNTVASLSIIALNNIYLLYNVHQWYCVQNIWGR